MLILSPAHRDEMTAHGQAGLPNESCGLLAGVIQGEDRIVKAVYCLANIDESPEHFSMAPEDQFNSIKDMRKKGLVLLGNFHTHPATPARPSAEDIRLAFDPSLSYGIISYQEREPVLKSFVIQKGIAAEEGVAVRETPETD